MLDWRTSELELLPPAEQMVRNLVRAGYRSALSVRRRQDPVPCREVTVELQDKIYTRWVAETLVEADNFDVIELTCRDLLMEALACVGEPPAASKDCPS
jgi:hypothetical protein